MKLGLRVLLRVKRLTFHNSGKREDYGQCKNIDISQLWRGRVPYLIPFPLEVAIYLNLIQSKCYIFSNLRFFDGVWFRIFALCKRYDILQLCLGRGKGSGAAGGKRPTVQQRFFLIRYCDIWSDLIASDLLMSSDIWSVDIWWLCRLCRVQGQHRFYLIRYSMTSDHIWWHLISWCHLAYDKLASDHIFSDTMTSDCIWSVGGKRPTVQSARATQILPNQILSHLMTSDQILWNLIRY